MIAGAVRDCARVGLSAGWWFGLPILIALVQIGARLLDRGSGFYFVRIESEQGLIENATAVILIPAACWAMAAAVRLRSAGATTASRWFLAVGLLCIAFCGEELNWGQHWFGWESPEFFERYNRQHETNLHNMNIHLGRVAKTALTAAILIGGIVIPLHRRLRGIAFEPGRSEREWMWPAGACVFTACLALAVRAVERVDTWFGPLPLMGMNLKETQEFYLACFLFLYLWSAWRRAAAHLPGRPAASRS
jgi:hypothetical protein